MTAAARWALLVALAGCGPAPDPPDPELSRRERDSMLGASEVLPGAAGVRGALRAVDTAQARNIRRDSLADAP